MHNPFVIDALEPRLFLAVTPFTPPSEARLTVDLNPSWRFKKSNPSGASGKSYNDSSWPQVSLPHTWNNKDGQDGGNNYYRGTGWYRKHVKPSSSMSGKRIYLRFDGANLATDVYVNGTLAGSHKGGYAAFVFDVTSLIKVGSDNVIAVKVNNSANSSVAPLSGGWTMGGGIYRDVRLIATSSSHIDMLDYGSPGVYLTPSNISTDSAKLAVKTKLRNDGSSSSSLSIQTSVVDADGNLVTSKTSSKTVSSKTSTSWTQTLTIDDPHLWQGRDDPYLYAVYVTLKSGTKVIDTMRQPLGIRYFSVDAQQGFLLNGQPYDLHGVAMHQDRLDKGFATTDADRAQDVSLIEEMGATFVRLSHYQHEQTTYDLLDRAGMVTWTELPNVNSVSTSTSFIDNNKQQLKELIRQNYNHPSVFFWGLFNEIWHGDKAAAVIPQLQSLARTEDPTRMTTGATYIQTPNSAALNNYTDLIATNRYYGWYDLTPDVFGTWADGFHAAYPNRPMGISEYGAGGSITHHEEDPSGIVPKGPWHPEEYQSLVHEATWPQMEARDYLWCKAIWNMFDFALDEWNEGDTAGRNDKGMVTYDRKTKKDAFHYYKANWSDENFVHITSRRWTDRTDPITDVKIYSNCDSVELFVNGQSLGIVSAPNHVFVWDDVLLAEGSNAIEAVPVSGEIAPADQVEWILTSPQPPEPLLVLAASRMDWQAVQFSSLKDLIDGQSKED